MRSIRRGFVGFVSGGAQPRDVAGAIVVGILAGFLLGFNYALVGLLLTALLFNLHGRTLLASIAAGCGGNILLEPQSYQLGRQLLDLPIARSTLAMLGDGPLATLLGANDYRLVGALVLALPASVGVAVWAAWMIRRARTRLVDAEACGGRRLFFSALFARVLIGGDSVHREKVLSAAPQLFRPWGAIAVLAAAPAALTVPWCIANQAACETLLTELSVANHGRVDAGAMELSLWTGKLEIQDLRFADPAVSGQDRLRIRRVTGRIRPCDLLTGRVHAHELKIEGLRTDVTGRGVSSFSGGRSYPSADRFAWNGSTDIASPAAATRSLALHENVKDWDQVAQRLTSVSELISYLRQLAEASQRQIPASTAGPGLSRQRPRLCQPTPGQPRLLAETVQIEDLPRAWSLGPKSMVEIANLTDDPVASGRPTVIRAVVPNLAAEVNVASNLHEPGQPHDLRVQIYRRPLSRLAAIDRYGPQVEIAGGTVDIVGEGWADNNQLNVQLRIDAQDLEVFAQGQSSIAGLSPALWNDVIDRLHRVRVQADLVGPWGSPRLQLDRTQLVRSLRRQLRAAGAVQLAAAVEDATGETHTTDDAQHLTDVQPPIGRPLVRESAPAPTVSPSALAEEIAENRTAPFQPTEYPSAAYPSTATPAGWVREPVEVVSTSAETKMAAGRIAFAAQQPTEPPASVATSEPATAQPAATSAAMAPAAAGPPATPQVPLPVDLALGYDSEPFSAIDRQLGNSNEFLRQAEMVQEALTGEDLEPSPVARWTRQARTAMTRAWPFRRAAEPAEDEFVDDTLPEYDPAQFEDWETTALPADSETSAATEPWYQRIWR